MSRLFDSVFRPSAPYNGQQRSPVQSYNLEIYAPTPKFPGLQSTRLPATNPSFEMARFLKSTGPGPSKLQDNSSTKSKRDRDKYKLVLQLVRKATKNLRSEEESSPNFKPPLVGVVQKASRSGTRYLQIVTPTSESDDNLSDHDEYDDVKCSVNSSQSVDIEDLKNWIAGLSIATEAENHSEEILPFQTGRSAIRRLRTSQSLDFEPSEAHDECKAEKLDVTFQDFPSPPNHTVLGTIRPRSSSLRGPPRMIAMPLDTQSDSTLSCTESEERLMESPTPEQIPRTEYITMTYDEGQDTLQIAQRIANLQEVPKDKVQGNDGSRKCKESGHEDVSKSVVRPLPDNLPKENYADIIEKGDGENFRDDSASISQLSSYSNMAYDYKGREERVRHQKIKDLHISRRRKGSSYERNIEIVKNEMVKTSYIGSEDEHKLVNAHHKSQVLRLPRKPVMNAREVVKLHENTSSCLASYQTDTSSATPKAKDLDMSLGVPDQKLIHPAYRAQLVNERFADEPALISDIKKAGLVNANTTLPNSIYQRPVPTNDGLSSILTSQLHVQGKNKPLPPIQNLRLKTHAISSETPEAGSIPAFEESKKNLERYPQGTSPISTVTEHSSSPSSSPSKAGTSVPAPSSSSSVTASPSISQSSPPKAENLEDRVKQLEHEKVLLRTALTAVLNSAGTLHSRP